MAERLTKEEIAMRKRQFPDPKEEKADAVPVSQAGSPNVAGVSKTEVPAAAPVVQAAPSVPEVQTEQGLQSLRQKPVEGDVAQVVDVVPEERNEPAPLKGDEPYVEQGFVQQGVQGTPDANSQTGAENNLPADNQQVTQNNTAADVPQGGKFLAYDDGNGNIVKYKDPGIEGAQVGIVNGRAVILDKDGSPLTADGKIGIAGLTPDSDLMAAEPYVEVAPDAQGGNDNVTDANAGTGEKKDEEAAADGQKKGEATTGETATSGPADLNVAPRMAQAESIDPDDTRVVLTAQSFAGFPDEMLKNIILRNSGKKSKEAEIAVLAARQVLASKGIRYNPILEAGKPAAAPAKEETPEGEGATDGKKDTTPTGDEKKEEPKKGDTPADDYDKLEYENATDDFQKNKDFYPDETLETIIKNNGGSDDPKEKARVKAAQDELERRHPELKKEPEVETPDQYVEDVKKQIDDLGDRIKDFEEGKKTHLQTFLDDYNESRKKEGVSDDDWERMEKSRQRSSLIAAIGDILQGFANIAGVWGGAKSMELTSLSEASAAGAKEVKEERQKRKDKIEKEYLDRIDKWTKDYDKDLAQWVSELKDKKKELLRHMSSKTLQEAKEAAAAKREAEKREYEEKKRKEEHEWREDQARKQREYDKDKRKEEYDRRVALRGIPQARSSSGSSSRGGNHRRSSRRRRSPGGASVL